MRRFLSLAQPGRRLIALAFLALLLPADPVLCQTGPPLYGPYNAVFLADGAGLRKPIPDPRDPVLLADSPWTLYCWINPTDPAAQLELIAGLGNVTADHPRFLAIDRGRAVLWLGPAAQLAAPADLTPNHWHLLAATFDGAAFHLYADGQPAASGALPAGPVNPLLQLAPSTNLGLATGAHFGGRIASFTLLRRALSDVEVAQLHQSPPDFTLPIYEEGSKPWPLQTRGQAGYRAPQDPSTMPHSDAPFSAPVAIKRLPPGPSLTPTAPGEWTFTDGWTLREVPKTSAPAARISSSAFDASAWLRATVPGTVLTTLIDDGIYPDPDFGLNNLAIPESLNKQDYWCRNQFTLPAAVAGRHVELTLQGINYKAAVWLNGALLGTMKGAFRRGIFDVTPLLRPGTNVLAILISPPPHPGIPQEQSILGGPGENGGAMVLDGPTFVATEGWDWIPAIRDRDSGLWQPVTLSITRALKFGDTQVVTTFPSRDTSRAAVDISVPVTNLSHAPVAATLEASIETLHIRKTLTFRPGETLVHLTPADFPSLTLTHPRLWWPNGYGAPNLYDLHLTLTEGTLPSDSKTVRFGIREISYELSLLDSTGHLRRVEFTPALARNSPTPIVDVSHTGLREIPSADAVALHLSETEIQRTDAHSTVASLSPAAESSAAIRPLTDLAPAPYLVIRVNGVRIAARGGNWGMDDARKRVSRVHLEPFFRLNRDANLNIIRNWVGQSTEQVFYDLADEYGMLVWNDFWESTQNYNIEAEDPALFLANAADVIQRFRNHPSILLWCGRNEGVPQPILNSGLEQLVRTLDGTRYYVPSSNEINLQGSGPYRYQDPARYFTTLNRGFSVETGTPSMSTLESFESTIAKPDQWPISDAWAYHDWHQSGNGVVAPFMQEIAAEFGAPTSLEDFERKAQMLNFVDHRAIFEGMNAHLFTPNSGRLLWMTQPAWPSTMWQILSSDYDTQASFYGVKLACEPIHVQLNLATRQVDVINTTANAHPGLTVSAHVFSLANALLFETTQSVGASADTASPAMTLDLAPWLARGMVLVQLKLSDAKGATLSQNLYWLGADSAAYRELNTLGPTTLTAVASAAAHGDTITLTVQLTNPAATPSLANKLTLLRAAGHTRILPAYYSDNYISLLAHETRTITIDYPAAGADRPELSLRGWNTPIQSIPIR